MRLPSSLISSKYMVITTICIVLVIAKIDEKEAIETIKLWEEILKEM